MSGLSLSLTRSTCFPHAFIISARLTGNLEKENKKKKKKKKKKEFWVGNLSTRYLRLGLKCQEICM